MAYSTMASATVLYAVDQGSIPCRPTTPLGLMAKAAVLHTEDCRFESYRGDQSMRKEGVALLEIFIRFLFLVRIQVSQPKLLSITDRISGFEPEDESSILSGATN